MEPVEPWAVDPAQRGRRRRRAVRVLVLDADQRVLLFQDSDPGVGFTWWMTPGGGVDEGETDSAAAARELREETGLVVPESDLLGPIATRLVLHGYSDHITEQYETFYLVRPSVFEVDISGHTEQEQLTVLQHRWWTAAELESDTDTVWPTSLVTMLAALDAPERWPLDLGRMEESSVPVE